MAKFILFITILALGFLGYYYLAEPSMQDISTGIGAQAQSNKEKPFQYKIDPRRFDQNPNNAAIEQGWTNKNDVMTLIKPKQNSLKPFYIDAYEAIISNYRAWSVPGQIPTDKLRIIDAQTACDAAGKRLCTETEWRTACRGGATQPIQFTDPNALMKVCDFARSNTYDENDYINKNNTHMACALPGTPVYNMIGNIAEFVEHESGQVMAVGLTYYDGKMKNKNIALKNACERTIFYPGQYPAERYNKGLGFRCCRNTR